MSEGYTFPLNTSNGMWSHGMWSQKGKQQEGNTCQSASHCDGDFDCFSHLQVYSYIASAALWPVCLIVQQRAVQQGSDTLNCRVFLAQLPKRAHALKILWLFGACSLDDLQKQQVLWNLHKARVYCAIANLRWLSNWWDGWATISPTDHSTLV